MKTPRELILERHQAAEAKLKALRAEDLAACARGAAEPSPARPPAPAPAGFWREAFWPWRRTWTAMAVIWVVILALTLASGEPPRVASARAPRPDPETLAILDEQKQLLAQLLGAGAPPPASRLRAPSPRSEAEPSPGRGAGADRTRNTGAQAWVAASQAKVVCPLTPTLSPSDGERVPFSAGEGCSEGPPGVRGSRCLRIEAVQRAPTFAQA